MGINLSPKKKWSWKYLNTLKSGITKKDNMVPYITKQ